jgi:hypothetical protein
VQEQVGGPVTHGAAERRDRTGLSTAHGRARGERHPYFEPALEICAYDPHDDLPPGLVPLDVDGDEPARRVAGVQVAQLDGLGGEDAEAEVVAEPLELDVQHVEGALPLRLPGAGGLAGGDELLPPIKQGAERLSGEADRVRASDRRVRRLGMGLNATSGCGAVRE